ncbi:hypothetical protein M407DRAFT_12693 [Tulasnella calospora MUT 4182]|uniref:Uncharacterized protein n=1 Tax=Tulasnella calospora MUT 4182 TaxID=1051891 RepID=A0A0C3L4Y9_9AGAM|nr:hypothetical protein M407DRAFT_12693 [Tulasnella calospora MUT 4182]
MRGEDSNKIRALATKREKLDSGLTLRDASVTALVLVRQNSQEGRMSGANGTVLIFPGGGARMAELISLICLRKRCKDLHGWADYFQPTIVLVILQEEGAALRIPQSGLGNPVMLIPDTSKPGVSGRDRAISKWADSSIGLASATLESPYVAKFAAICYRTPLTPLGPAVIVSALSAGENSCETFPRHTSAALHWIQPCLYKPPYDPSEGRRWGFQSLEQGSSISSSPGVASNGSDPLFYTLREIIDYDRTSTSTIFSSLLTCSSPE